MTGLKALPEPPEGLRVASDGPVLRLTLDRPQRRNALTDDIVLALIDIVEAAGSDDRVRVIALGAAGDHFCSGFDLSLRPPPDPDARPRIGSTQRQLRWHVNRLVTTMQETQTPIVAAVRGWCIGLGVHLALAADFAVVARDARFREPFTGIGFTPDSGGTWLLPRLVGIARAKELLMLGREISGATAADWGMVLQAVGDDELDACAQALVQELAGAATVAVGLTKQLIHHSLTNSLEGQLAEEGLAIELASRSDDFKEPARAKREGRPVRFEGR